ncbi:MAG: DNA alkylation repair protein [Actinobacteria bacterium]|nr:DNA alkylation repair protein [Actinomycetota bacterium]MBU1944365.1 DNA alkylation repair protein [Actinomycetota bacterium]MBU2688164.1 DNA alkylation repair protein [Actinomycetota bacterium]
MAGIDEVIDELKSYANPEAVRGMARYGISGEQTLGVSIPVLRKMAKGIGKDHSLAAALWDSGIHEARILAGMVDDPTLVTGEQAEAWVADLDSWDVCDQLCMNLLWLTPFAYDKAYEWAGRDEEFVKRAGFALMARLAWSDKRADDETIAGFLTPIKKQAGDGRNYVKKAVNWALRQVGKRNRVLNRKAIEVARELAASESPSARWVAADALRELEGEAVHKRLSGGR